MTIANNHTNAIASRKGYSRYATFTTVVLISISAVLIHHSIHDVLIPSLNLIMIMPSWIAHAATLAITVILLVVPTMLVFRKLKSSFLINQLAGSVSVAQSGFEFDQAFAELALNNLQDLFYVFDGVGRMLCWNQQLRDVSGYSDDEIASMNALDFFIKEDRKKVLKAIEQVWKSGPTHVEARHLTKDGRIIDYDLDGAILKDDHGVPILFYGTGRDISEQKAAQAEIQKLTAAVEQSPASIVITDIDGNIEYVNDKFTQITGYAAQEAIGKNPRILKSGHTSPREYQHLWDTITAGNEWRGEFLNIKKNGDTYWESAYIAPMTDEQGKIIHFLSIKEDITHRKIVEQQLNEAKEAAEKASRTKSEFLANMSHEIRTPMNGIIGMTELLLDSGLDNEQREYAQAVASSGKALLTIINDILDFSKIEAGQLEIENIPFDLRTTVEEIAAVLAPKVDSGNVEFIIHYNPETPRSLIGDPNRIRQVLINLANNAIKFTEKGHVLVSITTDEENDENLTVRFEVEDTGIGIPPDKINYVFGKFTQADTSTSRKYGGTGLGLAISKQLVELMGGTIGVRSELGKGSAFWFTLTMPVHKSNYDIEIPRDSLNDVRILVVDDNEINRKIFHEQLKRWRIEHDTCESGKQALDLLRSAYLKGRPFHMAILDYQMPRMGGLELAKAIKDDPLLKDTILIMASSVGKRNKQTQFRHVGLAAYLIKPVSQSLLLNTLVNAWDMNLAAQKHKTDDTKNASPPEQLKKQIEQFHADILVAEDNPVNQKLAAALLIKAGCHVDLVGNGLEALDILKTHTYDMILMDCQMPEMDGYEAAAEIRRRESQGSRALIIAMTANAMQGDRQKCIDAGMDDYISKPINRDKFYELLHKYLENKHPASVNA